MGKKRQGKTIDSSYCRVCGKMDFRKFDYNGLIQTETLPCKCTKKDQEKIKGLLKDRPSDTSNKAKKRKSTDFK